MKPIRLLLIAALAALLAACQEPLFSQLSEAEANEIVGLLLEQGIDAAKNPGDEQTWVVAVERRQFARAMSLLREANLPRDPVTGLGEVFRKDGLVSSPVEERARLIHALSQELSRTLGKIDGVVLARVHVVVPTPDPLTDRPKPASVSVFLKHRPEIDLTRHVPQIKALVLNGVEGASYDTVSVALFPADQRFEPAGATAANPSGRSPVGWLLAATLGLAALGGTAVLLVLRRRKRTAQAS